jgi:hypothetical protein
VVYRTAAAGVQCGVFCHNYSCSDRSLFHLSGHKQALVFKTFGSHGGEHVDVLVGCNAVWTCR